MKKGLLIIFIFSLFVFSCSNGLVLSDDDFFGIDDEHGALSISIEGLNARTILPQNINWSSFTGSFNIEIVNLAGGTENFTRTIGNLSSPITLATGNYNVTVTARNGTDVLARGHLLSVPIYAGTAEARVIVMRAIIDGSGNGTFRWDINIPAVTNANISILRVPGNTGDLVEQISITQGANTGTRELLSGYYIVQVLLTKDAVHQTVTRHDVLHVYQNLESVLKLEFSDAYFTQSSYNISFDYNFPGGGVFASVPVLHGQPLAKPADPVRNGFDFEGWYTDSALTASYDFTANTPIIRAFTLYAKWEDAGTVAVTTGGGTNLFVNLAAALASITTAGDYTVTVFEDQTLGSTSVNIDGADITLVGSGGERTIQFTGGSTPMLDLSGDDLRFTLENNITLKGSTGGNASLVRTDNNLNVKTYFIMKNGSKITGHNFTGSGTVFIRSGYFIMDGGEISGNHTSADFSLSASGLSLALSGTAQINGGRIKDNTQGQDLTDSDIAITSLDDALLILSGNSEIGVIRLFGHNSEASSITADNFTGTAIFDLVTLWSTLEETRSIWTNKQIIKPASGNLGAQDVNCFTPGNFFWDMAITDSHPISDTHVLGTTGENAGRLMLANAPVTVTVNGTTTGYADLMAALAAISTQTGDFTVTLYEDQTLSAGYTIGTADRNITIVGEGGMRTITHGISVVGTHLFTINDADASLTLGNNVTIQGRTAAGTGAVVRVSNGTFTMQGNSRIQGHNLSNMLTAAVYVQTGTFNMKDDSVITGVISSSTGSAAVFLSGSGTFNMQGGQITANSNSSNTTSGSAGVIAGGIINMTGGSITGNTLGTAEQVAAGTARAYDIYIDVPASDRFTISGNASIGALMLSTDETVVANVTVGAGGWSGSIATLNLRGGADTATVVSNWNNRQVFNGITAAQVAQIIALGDFINSSSQRQPITDTHILGTSGADLGRLITKPSVSVNNGTTTTNHANLTAAFTAIGTTAGNYTITLYEDQTMTANRAISAANQHITIVGYGGRTINGSTIGNAVTMFTINNASASLTLGNNVTIQGRANAGGGDLVFVSSGTFRMLEGSRLTGHQVNSATSSTVYVSSTGIFAMSGGSIDGNNNTAVTTNTNVSSGVISLSGTFNMTGGSVTGNTQGDASQLAAGTALAADVYIDINAADRFTMSGNATVGALKLNASATSGANVIIGAGGWSGSIGTLNLRSDNAAIATAVSNWNNRLVFSGITASQVTQIGLGDFIGTGNTRQAISPSYMIGNVAPNIGRLILANPPVTVTVNSAATPYASLDAAFTAIGTTAGNYTITLYENQTMTQDRTIGAGQNITFVSSAANAANERTIQYNGAANAFMFFLNSNTASLTLGNNITLAGITTGTNSLLYVQNGTLTIQSGSKVTGHTTTRDVIVVEGANSRFVMSGGTITGNTTTWTGGSDISGGVLINSGAAATITGGSITGNSPVDLFIHSAVTFNLSGDAAIGNMRLNASSAAANASITLGAFTGTIGSLNLRSENAVMNTAVSWWLDKQIIQAAAGYTLTPADIAKFPPGNFISTVVGASQTISPDYMIGTALPNTGRLILANPAVTVTSGGETTGYADLAAAFASITAAGDYTVTLLENQTMTAGFTIIAGQNITITGSGGVRTINGSTIGESVSMFTIANFTASLTLGNNVTIQGRSTAGSGVVVHVQGGTFTMQGNSRIQEHSLQSISGAVFMSGGTFNMRDNAVITGVSASFSGSAAVVISGDFTTFNMEGGQITANSNSNAMTTTTASGGILVNSGIFNMIGGSITGNTQLGEASDVYITNFVADRFTMSGNATIGALKLNARDASDAANVTISAGGWTGSITTLNLRGNNTNIATAMGMWTENTEAIFNGITAAQVARIGLGEFISSNNARQAITNTHIIGTTGTDLGRLIPKPAVTVTSGATTTNYANLDAAFAAITTAGDYTITLYENQTMTAGRTISANQNITIVGSGGIRTITHGINDVDAHLFMQSATGTSLTLGNNITIQGRTAAGAGAVMSMGRGSFTMQGNSRIQGHNINGTDGTVHIADSSTFNMRDNSVITGVSSSTVTSAAVRMNSANATFNMEGGQITANNNTTAITDTSASGGIIITSGRFNMTGGSITGNTQSGQASDVYYASAVTDRFNISGNAQIGVLKLNSFVTTNAAVTIGAGGWTGAVTTLNLRGDNADIATAAGYWNNRQVFNNITAAQVANIGLGEFISNSNARQTITDTHIIGTVAPNIGRLILKSGSAGFTITAPQITEGAPTINTGVVIYHVPSAGRNSTATIAAPATGTNIRWLINGVVIQTGNDPLVLNVADNRYNGIGTHSLTLEITIGGVPYSRTVVFGVEFE